MCCKVNLLPSRLPLCLSYHHAEDSFLSWLISILSSLMMFIHFGASPLGAFWKACFFSFLSHVYIFILLSHYRGWVLISRLESPSERCTVPTTFCLHCAHWIGLILFLAQADLKLGVLRLCLSSDKLQLCAMVPGLLLESAFILDCQSCRSFCFGISSFMDFGVGKSVHHHSCDFPCYILCPTFLELRLCGSWPSRSVFLIFFSLLLSTISLFALLSGPFSKLYFSTFLMRVSFLNFLT